MSFISLKEKFLENDINRGFRGILDPSERPLIKKGIPVEKDIPEPSDDKIDGTFRVTDTILRGDAQLGDSLLRRVTDTSRIGKWFTTPQGLLFTAKQNVLSALGVKTQGKGIGVPNEGPYLPTSTLGSVATSGLGIYLTKQGVDPTNLTNLGTPTYWKDENNKNIIRGGGSGIDNRLVKLTNSKITNTRNIERTNLTNRLFTSDDSISENNNEILRYFGGPGSIEGTGTGSIGGIGRTIIEFADQRTGKNNVNLKDNIKLINYRDLLGTTNENENSPLPNLNIILSDNEKISTLPINKGIITKILPDFRALKKLAFGDTTTQSPDYTKKDIESRVNLNSPGDIDRDRIDYSVGIKYSNKETDALDTINAFPLYQSTSVNPDNTNIDGVLNDLVKFRIAAIDNEKPENKVFMHFRAFLESFDDNYSPTWNGEKYVGRGDTLYRYQGFTRGISLRWNVVAQSAQELMPMYRKLNYLASNTMPDYSEKGFMRGPLIQLTVGEYLYEQVGFITQLSFTPNFDAGWEIGVTSGGEQASTEGDKIIEVGELPKMIQVQMAFTPIHEFVPAKVKGTLAKIDRYEPSNNPNFRGKKLTVPPSNRYLINQFKNYIALTRENKNFDNY